MLPHLDDPNPPEPTSTLLERLRAEGRRRRRHRARLVVGVLAVGLVAVGVGVARPWVDDDDTSVVVDEGTTTTTTVMTSTTDTAPTSSTSAEVDDAWPAGPDASSVFAGITVDGDIVLADIETGTPVLTLGTVDPNGRSDVARAQDGTAVFVASAENGLWRYTPDRPPERLGDASTVAVSPDGRLLATLSEAAGEYGTMRILDSVTGETINTVTGESLTGSPELTPWNVEWDWNGERLLVEAALPEAGGEVFLVGVDGDPPVRLGPPDGLPNGTGWTLGGPADRATIWIVETCCALDANSFDGGRTLLRVDSTSGGIIERLTLDFPYALVDPGPPGSGVDSLGFLLSTSCCGDPATEVRRGLANGQVAPAGWTGFIAVDW